MKLQEILEQLENIERNMGEKKSKKMNLPVVKKIVKRLDAFITTCDTCKVLRSDFITVIGKMSKESNPKYNKKFKELTNDATKHLEEVHNLVPEDHYTNIYMSYGVALGLVFGGAFSQMINQTALIAIGLTIGISIGLSIGAKKDEEAKKEGLQI